MDRVIDISNKSELVRGHASFKPYSYNNCKCSDFKNSIKESAHMVLKNNDFNEDEKSTIIKFLKAFLELY